jgi:hypothetical protein
MSTLYKFTTGTVANPDQVNTNIEFLCKNLLITAMNAGAANASYQLLYVDILGSDSATTKTNWTYGTSLYKNTGTAQAILEFKNLLTKEQKDVLVGSEQTALVWVDQITYGDTVAGVVSNPSFETAGGGGADVFANWTETTSGAAVTFTRDTGTGVTYGTYCCHLVKSGSTAYTAGDIASVSQSINFTGVKKIIIDAICGPDSGPYSGVGLKVYVDADTVYTTPVGQSCTILNQVIDVSSYSGSHTLKIAFTYAQAGSSYACSWYLDNVRTVANTTANTTRVYKLSYDGGTNWSAVSNGALTQLPSVITDVGVRVEDTRTDANAGLYNMILGFGFVYG